MLNKIKNDLLPSVVVFLVAVPLCIGIAIACGVSPVAGLLSGIIGGLVVGSLNGCPLMVSGPAAGLIAIVWEIINVHGLTGLALCVAVAGCLQMIFGLLGAGVIFRAVSPAVIQGMLTGIGALIFFSQFHVMIDSVPQSSGLMNLLAVPEAIVHLVSDTGKNMHYAGIVGVITIAVIYAWSYVPVALKQLPGVLVGVIIGTGVAQLAGFEITFVQAPKTLLTFPDFSASSFWAGVDYAGVAMSSVGLAFIATAQALLTATATDKLHDGEKTDYNREVFAQGLGNLVSGLVGALPVTGVIVRSAANAQSGGKTRVSAILHAVWILTFILLLPGVLGLIPVATLAAALVYTGGRLMNPATGIALARQNKVEAVIYAVTAVSIFAFGLLQGVLIGFALALMQVIYRLNHVTIEVESKDEGVTVVLHGNATFLAIPKLSRAIDKIEPQQKVHVLIERLNYIDHAIIDLLDTWQKDYERSGGELSVEWHQLHNLH